MISFHFEKVLGWMRHEREVYQTEKFDYETEKEKDVDYWIQQFDSYIQRLPVFGLDTIQGKQAALKLAATAVALCEHLSEKGPLPMPGVSSGIIEEWNY